MPTARVTTRGRVTIPASVRNELRLRPGEKVHFVVMPNGDVMLRTNPLPFEELQGALRRPRGTQPVSVEEMDRGIEMAVRPRYRKSSPRLLADG